MKKPIAVCLGIIIGSLACGVLADDGEQTFPRYKPSSRSPQALDIRTNSYGASRYAPDAVQVGETVPDFTVFRAGGGQFSLAQARASGPVVIIFYRGHW